MSRQSKLAVKYIGSSDILAAAEYIYQSKVQNKPFRRYLVSRYVNMSNWITVIY